MFRSTLAALLTLVSLASVAQSQAPAPSMDFGAIPGYRLEVDKTPINSANFYFSPGRKVVLVRDTASGLAFEINARIGRVNIHQSSNFLALDNGELELIAGKGPSSHVPLKTVNKRPTFTHDGSSYVVADKPALLGPQTSASIQKDDPYYTLAATKYQPTPKYLAALRVYTKPTTVKVFFGSWCQNCHKWLPNIIRVENELKGTNIRFEYHGLPNGSADPVAVGQNVRNVPTGILLQDGKEIGRVSGPSWKYPDLQLHRVLGL